MHAPKPICIALALSLTRTSASCDCANASLCAPLASPPPEREVFAFTTSADDYTRDDWDWTATTTVAAFMSEIPHELICTAHEHGARVVLGADYEQDQLTNETARTAWIATQLARLDSLGADGLNLDIEGSRAENRDALTALVAELAAALRGANPRAQLSFDTGIYPLGQADAYDHVALAVSLDFFVPMAYDMCWGAGAAAANCPIGGLGAGLAQYTNDLNISAAQLVVGLPWYGWDFPCADATAGAPCDVAVPDGAEWFGWCTQVSYSTARAQLSGSSASELAYDNETVTAWFEYFADDGDDSAVRHQLWFDDPTTLSAKYAIARGTALRGVAFWTADQVEYDNGEAASMWGALASFGGGDAATLA